jgi:hypothetical protein
MATGLTIRLGDKDQRISIEALTNTLENALDMLRSLEREIIVGEPTTVHWEVAKASMRSPLSIMFVPRVVGGRPGVGRKIVATCVRGIKEIQSSPNLPRHFNERSLEAAKELVMVAHKEGVKIAFGTNHKDAVQLTDMAAVNIQEVLEKAPISLDFDTVEGTLEIISIHKRPSFCVYETLTNKRIDCRTATTDQFQQAVAWIGKRVSVTGRVRYRSHQPELIYVDGMELMPEMTQLPQPRDMEPINITEGLSSEEHVRRMRDAQ